MQCLYHGFVVGHKNIGIKANAWKYEDEVRLVKEDKTVLLYARSIESQTKSFKEVYTKTEAHIKQKESDGLINRKYCFKRGALVEISFGCNSTQRSIEEIRSILNEYGYKTKLKKAKPNLTKFGLKYNDF